MSRFRESQQAHTVAQPPLTPSRSYLSGYTSSPEPALRSGNGNRQNMQYDQARTPLRTGPGSPGRMKGLGNEANYDRVDVNSEFEKLLVSRDCTDLELENSSSKLTRVFIGSLPSPGDCTSQISTPRYSGQRVHAPFVSAAKTSGHADPVFHPDLTIKCESKSEHSTVEKDTFRIIVGISWYAYSWIRWHLRKPLLEKYRDGRRRQVCDDPDQRQDSQAFDP